MCGETFSHSDDYCAHLEHREAVRTLHGVQGFGGALTVKPAGTATTFDHDSMMVVASHRLARSDHNQTEGANDMDLEEKIAQLESEQATAQARIAELEGELETTNASLVTANENLKTAADAAAALRWSIREQKLAQAGYDAEKLETDKVALAAMADAAFDILVAALTPPDPGPDGDGGDPALGTVNLGGGGGDDDKVEILWPEDD